MRHVLINALILTCFLVMPVKQVSCQDWKGNIEDVYKRPDNKKWGDIFSWAFDRKEFRKSYALVIGVGDYKEKGLQSLESPYHDARRVSDFLINEAGFDYVVTLTNSKATRQKINEWMVEKFPEKLTDEDKFLFYFSGHGTQRNINGLPFGYLVLNDCGLKSYANMIAMDDVERWDRLLFSTRHILFILDCCFSGLAGTQRKSPLMNKKISRLSQYGHHLITAGTANEQSLSSLKKWHGSLFTDSFLRAVQGRADLSSGDYGTDGIISLKELMKYIEDRIDAESVKLKSKNPLSKGIKMSPQISELQQNEGEFFFITKNIKNKKVGNVVYNKLDHGWPIKTKGELVKKSAQPQRKIAEQKDFTTLIKSEVISSYRDGKINLRNCSTSLSLDDVKKDLKEKNLFDKYWNKKAPA